MPATPWIHPTAVIDAQADVAADVRIGAYAIIQGPVRIGTGCVLHAHTQILGRVTLGSNNEIGAGSVLGGEPQHLGYKGEDTALEIGNGNRFREHCTVHRAMPGGHATRIGDRNYFMVGSHVGHDAQVGNDCILVNGAALGGHVQLQDRALLSAYSAVHQLCRIGRLAMLSGQAAASKDIPPFWIIREVNVVCGVNVIGMRRAGIATAEIHAVREAFKYLYLERLPIPTALEKMERHYSHLPAVMEIVSFIRASKRGIPGGHFYRGEWEASAA